MRTTLLTVLCCVCTSLSLGPNPVFADDHPVTMWKLQGQNNRIFLLGSVHLLRQSDYPLPSVINDAYDQAETLIMEVDMDDDADPLQMQELILEYAMITDGDTLTDKIGAQAYAKAAALADQLELPLAMLESSQPWFAAMTVEILLLTRIGFDPSNGVESHFMSKAQTDGKEILGLETARQQIELMAGLSPAAQRDMLLQVLAEGVEMQQSMDDVMTAWRHGDTRYMRDSMLSGMQESRELYQTLVADRNNDWVKQINALLVDDVDYLIIVGALHLIGPDGVPEKLKNHGVPVEQMHQRGN